MDLQRAFLWDRFENDGVPSIQNESRTLSAQRREEDMRLFSFYVDCCCRSGGLIFETMGRMKEGDGGHADGTALYNVRRGGRAKTVERT
jgi:hypothetical protein